MKILYIQRIIGVILGLALCLAGGTLVHGGRQSNSQYIIEKDVINAGGGRSQSATYTQTGSLGQSSPLGRSTSFLLVNYGGFWGGGMTSPFYTLTVTKSGTGSGTVTGGGITCGPACSEQTMLYEEHTSIVLQAQEEPDSTFDGWLVNGSPVTGEITVTENVTITAVFTTNVPNQPPVITSTPPSITGRVYTYDVEADDPDNNPLTFSLLTAPAGMTIDTQIGLITWEPTLGQLGDHQVEVQVSDGLGGVDTQTFTLHVSAEFLSSATIGFYQGFNAENGQAACDPDALVLVPGTMEETAEILLPGANPFDFPSPMHWYLAYEPSPTGSLLLVLEPGVTGVLLNIPYETVDENDIAGLSVWPAGKHVTSSDTVIILTPGGSSIKIGNFQDNPNTWTVSFDYAELQP
jgi:hypothetical protein